MLTYSFINTQGDELEVEAESFEEACHLMFGGSDALDPKHWEFQYTY